MSTCLLSEMQSTVVQVEMMQLEVHAFQAEASSAHQAAEAGQAAVLEVERLSQDNALLAARLSQMDFDLQASLTYHLQKQFATCCIVDCFCQACMFVQGSGGNITMMHLHKLYGNGSLTYERQGSQQLSQRLPVCADNCAH